SPRAALSTPWNQPPRHRLDTPRPASLIARAEASRPTSETRSLQGAIQPRPARAHASAAWGSVHAGIVAWVRLRRPSALVASVKPRLRTRGSRGSALPPAPGRSASGMDLRFRAEVEDRLHRGPPFPVSRLGYALLHGAHELVPFPGPRVIVD